MVCDLSLNAGREKESLVVSAKSLTVDEKGETYVYVLNDNKNDIIKKKVLIGKYRNNNVEIKEGLSEGDLVIKEGKEKLVGDFDIML